MKKWILILGCVLGTNGVASAANDSVGLGVVGGTLGGGITVTAAVNDILNARVLVSGLSVDDDFDEDELTYEGDVKLFNIGALLDYHPFAGGLRVTGGLIGTRNRVEASATCEQAGGCDISDANPGNDVSNGDRVIGEVDYSGVAPYLGIGWGNSVEQAGRWSFSADLGAMFTGSPDVDASCARVSGGFTAACNAAIDDEEEDLEDEVGDFDVWPVLMIGAAYRF